MTIIEEFRENCSYYGVTVERAVHHMGYLLSKKGCNSKCIITDNLIFWLSQDSHVKVDHTEECKEEFEKLYDALDYRPLSSTRECDCPRETIQHTEDWRQQQLRPFLRRMVEKCEEEKAHEDSSNRPGWSAS